MFKKENRHLCSNITYNEQLLQIHSHITCPIKRKENMSRMITNTQNHSWKISYFKDETKPLFQRPLLFP